MTSAEIKRKSEDIEDPIQATGSDTSEVDPAEVEKAAPAQPSHDFPDGGPRAWAVAIGTSFVLFATLGYVNSFG
jgi:hypothetical protein